MRYFSLGLIAAAASLTGCASIVNGQNQSVSVETRADTGPVSGAYCSLNNNKGTWFVTTPGSATVQRSYEALNVKCTKDQMDPGMATVNSATKAMAFGNIIFGGVIGAGVDIATGAAYDYPVLITVEMGKTTVVAPPAPPASARDTSPAAPAPVPAVAPAVAPAPATSPAPAPAASAVAS